MTAENRAEEGLRRRGLRAASMRPRPMTAENRESRRIDRADRPDASMRPRPMTAENRSAAASTRPARRSFNEAAADDRGKPYRRLVRRADAASFNEAAADDRGKPDDVAVIARAAAAASMRPRPMTAENPNIVTHSSAVGPWLQ